MHGNSFVSGKDLKSFNLQSEHIFHPGIVFHFHIGHALYIEERIFDCYDHISFLDHMVDCIAHYHSS